VHEDYYNMLIFKWILIAVGAVPVRPSNSRNAMQNIVSLLNKNCVVGIFPEGEISTNGELSDLKRGFEKILSESKDDVIVIPFGINDMWGTFFSKAPKAIKKKQKFCFRRDIHINIGSPLNANVTRSEVKKSISNLLI
jgi:acyl-[acyl-carrier-protein]-phospholipid O-acyltransferase/long-chain-fatty-acid--[acyl-carrier-protein] ligase